MKTPTTKALHTAACTGLLSLTILTPATATDFAGNLKGVTIIDAANANKPPVAAFTSAVNGNTITFDASSSSDPDGNIAKYRWDFENGTTSEGATATRTLTGTGRLQVTLTVADNNNGVAINQQVINSASSINFIGPPGSRETFESGSNSFKTGQFTKYSGATIDTYSTTYYHGGTHGAWLGGVATDDWNNKIVADIGFADSGYTLEFWIKTPVGSYDHSLFFAAATDPSIQSYSAGALMFHGVGAPYTHIVFYDYIGGAGDFSGANLAENASYRIVLKMTNGAASTCEIYDTAGTLVTTMTRTLPAASARYFAWRPASSSGISYGIDDIQYNSTNP